MKHRINITLILLAIFLLSHIIGLKIIDAYLPKETSTGIVQKELPLGLERPEVEESTSFITIFIIIIVSTILALILMKFNALRLWKFWFFISIAITLTIALNAFIDKYYIALVIGVIVALIKVLRQNVIINNLAELFIYGGLAAIFVNILNLLSITILLVLISIYDFYSVYKSKHMVKLAKFQTKSKVFAGINIPYHIQEEAKGKQVKVSKKFAYAILGGGDIGFTLFFSGVVLKEFSFQAALITSFVTTLALLGLFLYSKKGRFYPAMPVLTFGCFIGLVIVRLFVL